MDQQQRELSKLGIGETRMQAQRLLLNQQLLAALQDQRARSIASDGKLFQISQTQQIILQSQPLGSLDVRLTFGGFTRDEFRIFEEGRNDVLGYRESDDDYGRMLDALPDLDNANLLRKVVSPMFAQYFAGSEGLAENPDAVLVIDLDGTGSWLLPLGFTAANEAQGFVFNRDWLSDASDPFGGGAPREGLVQDISGCKIPTVGVDADRRTVTLDWSISGACMPHAMHRTGSASALARLNPRPKAILLASASDFSRIDARNVTASSMLPLCPSGSRRNGKYIALSASPNANPAIGVVRTLYASGDAAPITTQPTAYDGPEMLGACLLFAD